VITKEILSWAQAHSPGIAVRLAKSEGGEPFEGITVSFMGAERAAAYDDRALRPLRLALTYRVSVSGKKPEEAHNRLCELLFAAMAHPFLALEGAGGEARRLPMEIVPRETALRRYGAAPDNTCFHLDILVDKPRHAKLAPPVREPAILKSNQMK
jgi:hypothetical protein